MLHLTAWVKHNISADEKMQLMLYAVQLKMEEDRITK